MLAVILLVQVVSTSQTPVKNDIPSIQVLVIQCMTGRTSSCVLVMVCLGFFPYSLFPFLIRLLFPETYKSNSTLKKKKKWNKGTVQNE